MKRMLRVKEVANTTGLGVSTVWKYVKEDKFPKPYKISDQVTVWNSEEIESWMDDVFKGAHHE